MTSAPAPDQDKADRLQADDRGPEGMKQRVESDIDALLTDTVRERDEYLELAKRTQADFENYRKRVARESAAAESRGRAGLARELLSVADNLERALSNMGGGSDPQADRTSFSELAAGVKLVYDELVGTLKRAGVESFEPSGEKFDPALHEAVMTQPVEAASDGAVVQVMEKGYRLGDQVLRPARVVVGKAEEVV